YFLHVRALGPYWFGFAIMVVCNLLLPQLYWVKKFRRSLPLMFAISITTNIGMWFERFVICCVSLHRDYLPSSWDYFSPSLTDVGMYVGSFGLFFTLFLLFLRFLPMVAIAEIKGVLPQAAPHAYSHGAGHGTLDPAGATGPYPAVPYP